MALGPVGAGLGGQLPVTSGIAGTTRVATGGDMSNYVPARGYDAGLVFDGTGVGNAAGVTTGTSMMGPAIQTIWSKEILFQSMPVLRFEQFAVKKTELGTMPGLTVNFMRYNNLPVPSGPLAEGVRMKTHAITANQYAITVAEQGFAVAVSEMLLNASFDDIMASSSRLLGRNMALYMDSQARDTLTRASSVVFGYAKPTNISSGYGVYEPGTVAPNVAAVTAGAGNYWLHPHSIKDAVEVLSSKNVPRLGETYVAFVHPHQSRRLRDTPDWIEVTKYASPGNFMLGEIGRIDDVVFIETTQITNARSTTPWTLAGHPYTQLPGTSVTDPGAFTAEWRTDVQGTAADGSDITQPFADASTSYPNADIAGGQQPAVITPGWGEPWGPNTATDKSYEAVVIGDNAFGHAISLPVELRDGGVLDFGREHALAWYSIWGWGVVTESSVVKIITN